MFLRQIQQLRHAAAPVQVYGRKRTLSSVTSFQQKEKFGTALNRHISIQSDARNIFRHTACFLPSSSSSLVRSQQLHHKLQLIRWKSGGREEFDQAKKGSNETATKPTKQIEGQMDAEGEPQVPRNQHSDESSSSLSHVPIAEQIEQRIKRVVDDLNLGDKLTVIMITVLTVLILVAPYAVRQMKKSDRMDYSDSLSEDPVDNLVTTVRRAWNNEEREEDEATAVTALELMLKDIIRSHVIQEASQQLVVQIFEAPEVKASLNRLVKGLWTDLVSDPETVAQVIRLLQIAIENKVVKDAAQKLVIDLVNEPKVKQAVIGIIQQLGLQDEVLKTTQSLITEATHKTLNDPEILDHSMEFATDVVGDDLVQRTAGEALRKSVGYAVRPVTTVILTAAGVWLMIFGIAAIGYSRSSDQDAALFETAARSLQTNATYGIMRLVTWPGRAMLGLLGRLKYVVLIPVHGLYGCVVGIGKRAGNTIANTFLFVLALPLKGVDSISRGIATSARFLVDCLVSSVDMVDAKITSSAIFIREALVDGTINLWKMTVAQLITAIQNVFQYGLDIFSRTTTPMITKASRILDSADEKVLDFYAKLVQLIEELMKHLGVRTGHILR